MGIGIAVAVIPAGYFIVKDIVMEF
jgi:hypothetical protein